MAAARPGEPVCGMQDAISELEYLDVFIGKCYVILEIDECPIKAVHGRIREHCPASKKPRLNVEQESPSSGSDGLVYEVHCARDTDCYQDCPYCAHIAKAAVAKEVAAFLGGIKGLGEKCSGFLEWPLHRDPDRPILTLPGSQDPITEIYWEDIDPDTTYRVPGSVTRVLSKFGTFRPFTVFRVFSLSARQIALGAAASYPFGPKGFLAWNDSTPPLPHVVPLLNQALRQLLSNPTTTPPQSITARWEGHSANVVFRWDEETKTPVLTSLNFTGISRSAWPSRDVEIISRKAAPITVLELEDQMCRYCAVMGLRQGCWVYILAHQPYCELCDIMDSHNLEPLCETPYPRLTISSYEE